MRRPFRLSPLKRLRDMRIRKKILLSNMVIILMLALAIGTAATTASRHYIQANTRELSARVIDQYSKNVDNHVKEFVSSTLFLLNDELLTHIVAGRDEGKGGDRYAVDFSRVSGLLYQYGNNNPSINSVTIMDRGGRLYWWQRPASGTEMNADTARGIATKAEALLAESGQGIYWSASLRGTDEVALSRYYLDMNQVNRNFGVIVFHLDRAYFMNLLSEGSIIQADNLLILNENDEPLFEGDAGLLAAIRASARAGARASSDEETMKIDGHPSLMLRSRSEETGWSVLCFIPMARLMEGTRILETMIAFICALFIFVAMAVAFWFSIGTTRDIKLLERTMRRVEDGDLTVKAIPAGKDEIGMLAVRFNMMVARINELVVRVSEERLAKQQAEYSVLLARINPHFLYNTLGMIRWFSRSRGQTEIESMVGALNGLLQSSIRRSGGMDTLGGELGNVRDYVHLQKIGYGDAFEVEYEVDEGLLDAQVPGFILQPLVENAIMHGLEISKGHGRIRIGAERRGTDIRISVEDNGIGMDPAFARELLASDRERRYPGLNGIGVRHVHERIRVLYGEPYGMSFDTAPGAGTTIILTMPYRREEGTG
ncbi:cache domain-containing sensor histidine kinase [Cohnella zeiphila]|uniref:histidine kinase n=1 Tax=Cohnella zeiphila TaxID=2761120 RepID=A0A7X0VU51_9BACL|nr:histidine kinase [Cohnella zeiphila]MBB6730030.1 sensor histidine kinase [Cohnella zeiphila]